MGRESIKKERMQSYFVNAAKELIDSGGAEQVSARNVARLAGYSYGTIYNYFTDLNHLLWYVSLEYISEIGEVIDKSYEEHKATSLIAINKVFERYVNFYLAKPAVYHFLFFQQLGEPPKELRAKIEAPSLMNRLVDHLGQATDLSAERGLIVANILTAMVHGLLATFFANKNQLSETQLLSQVDQGINYILGIG